MAELTVDFTYGQALFEAAQEGNKTELIAEEGKAMVEIFHNEKTFLEFVATPVYAAHEKKEAVGKVFEGKVSPELINLLYVLIDKGRAKHFERIIKRYLELLDESHGFSRGTIYSVAPLTDAQLASFEEQTGKLLKKQVKLENLLDASMLGGVKVFIEGKMIDASIQSRLAGLTESLNK